MKHFTLKLFLLIACLCGATSVWAQTTISTLPFENDFSTSVEPFDAGTISSDGNIGDVLHVSNTTATATWGTGSEPYTLADGEEVTVSFTAYHGWAPNLTSTVSLINDNEEELVSYTYTQSCTVTDVKIGGNKVNNAGFTGQAKQANGTANADGLGGKKPFGIGANVTMIVRKNGSITFNFVHEKAGVNKTFTANVGEKAATIKYMKITDATSAGDRSINIDNLNITSVISTTPQHTYSIIWKDKNDNSTIKEETGLLGDENSTPVISQESFFYNEKKYDYVSDNAAPLTTDDTEIIVVCKEADKCAYTINAVKSDDHTQIIKQITTGTVYAGESVVVPYPKYVLSGGTLFEKGVNNKEYRQTVTISSENPTVAFPYTATTITDVVYFSEAEDIPGATPTTAGNNMQIRSSNASCGYVTEDVILANLPAGIYAATMVCYSNSSGGAIQKFTFGTTGYDASISGSSNWSEFKTEFVLNNAEDIIWVTEGSSKEKNGLDFIYIQRTGDVEPETVEITPVADMITFCSPENLDFSNVEGLKAYIITDTDISDNDLAITPVDVVPAGTGVLLKGTKGTTYKVPVVADEPALYKGNILVAAEEDVALTDGEAYILTAEGKFNLCNAGTLAMGKAYIPASSFGGSVKELSLSFAGATAINGIENAKTADNAIFNLAGQRVAQPTKGIYIVNGKKVFVK